MHFYKKLQIIKPIAKKKQTMEVNCFMFLIGWLQGRMNDSLSSNLFAHCWKFSYFVARTHSALSDLPDLDFPQLLYALGKRLTFQSTTPTTRFKKLLNKLLLFD